MFVVGMQVAVVKCVLSGDSLVLRPKIVRNGPPPERILVLAGIEAPRLGKKGVDDEVGGGMLFGLWLRVAFRILFTRAFETTGGGEGGAIRHPARIAEWPRIWYR